jgi:hypothetical protein
MATLRRAKYLRCFYCGTRSSTRFEGQASFFCPTCESTNYLDQVSDCSTTLMKYQGDDLQNQFGDITDPPVATTSSPESSTRYTVPRVQSPEASTPPPSKSIFCAECLNNQHLFATCLAQYLPEDPDDPDYAKREQEYYSFRRRLEARYPQMCADCEPKVLSKLRDAGYTAKTDHLRRMMERSRAERSIVKKKTPLDYINIAGRWLWISGLGFQLLWHISYLSLAMEDATITPTSTWWQSLFLLFRQILDRVPAPDFLMSAGIWTNLLSIWWNPQFIQVTRGFSRHIVGLLAWYIFQILIFALRIASMKFAALSEEEGLGSSARLAAHLITAFLMTTVG